jgi:hypothetical protein
MTAVNRVDQAVLLLQDRLRRLQERTTGKADSSAGARKSERSDALTPLRRMARQSDIGEDDLQRALVRTLLEGALGTDLVASMAFNSIADQVVAIMQRDEAARALLTQALAELD